MPQEPPNHRLDTETEDPAVEPIELTGPTDEDAASPVTGPADEDAAALASAAGPVDDPQPLAATVLNRDATCLSAYRAVRLLHILERRTGEGVGISMADIIEELEHPGDGVTPPLKSSKKRVFSAIAALRAAGHTIGYDRATGYHLITRPLPDEEIVRLLAMVDRSRTLPTDIKRSMSRHLAAMASADISEYLEPRQEPAPPEPAPAQPAPPAAIGIRELLERAQGQAMPVAFDILPLRDTAGARRERCSVQPIDIREQDGRAYLLGIVVAGEGAEDALRTVAIDRMRNVECRLLDGSKLMAALDDTEEDREVA